MFWNKKDKNNGTNIIMDINEKCKEKMEQKYLENIQEGFDKETGYYIERDIDKFLLRYDSRELRFKNHKEKLDAAKYFDAIKEDERKRQEQTNEIIKEFSNTYNSKREEIINSIRSFGYSELFSNIIFDKCEKYTVNNGGNYYYYTNHFAKHYKLIKYIESLQAENISKDIQIYLTLKELETNIKDMDIYDAI